MIKLPSGKIVCLKKNKYPYGGIYNQYNSLFQPNQNYSNTLLNIFGTINYGLKDNYIYNNKKKYDEIYDLEGNLTGKEYAFTDNSLNKKLTNFSKGWELGTQALFGLGQDLYNNKLSREKARISQQNYRDEPFTYYDNFNNFYNPLNRMYAQNGALIKKVLVKKNPDELVDPALFDPFLNEIYYYPGRPDSIYKKDEDGNWLISNNSTKNKFVKIKDPDNSRTKILNKEALSPESYRRFTENLKNNIINYPESILIKDNRKIRKTTGEKINPNIDLKTGSYNKSTIQEIVKRAKQLGIDPYLALSVGLQETNLGKTDTNIGHIVGENTGNPYLYLNILKEKIDKGKKLFPDDIEKQIQVYNGLGKINATTENDYHGFNMKKIYGVPIPKEGINMKETPLYGKEILDIRDNILKQNPELIKYVDSIKPAYYEKGGLTSLDYLDAIQNNDLDSEEFNDIRNRYYGDMEDITYNNFNNIKENEEDFILDNIEENEEDFILDNQEEYNYNNQNNIFINPNSKINLKLKNNNVNVTSLHPNLIQFTNDLFESFPGLVITSGNDSKHMKGSRHYDNLAIDIGANSSDKKQYDNFLELIKDPINLAIYKEKYGIEDIISEGDHIHIELKKNKAKYGMIVDNEGYRKSNINNFTPVKYIDSNYIDTNNMSVPAINANGHILYNNTGTHYIPGNGVIEYPVFQNGGISNPMDIENYYENISNIINNNKNFKQLYNYLDSPKLTLIEGRSEYLPENNEILYSSPNRINAELAHAIQYKAGLNKQSANIGINTNIPREYDTYTISPFKYDRFNLPLLDLNNPEDYKTALYYYDNRYDNIKNFGNAMGKGYDFPLTQQKGIYPESYIYKVNDYNIYLEPDSYESEAHQKIEPFLNNNGYKNGGLIKLPSGKFVTIKNK